MSKITSYECDLCGRKPEDANIRLIAVTQADSKALASDASIDISKWPAHICFICVTAIYEWMKKDLNKETLASIEIEEG